MSSFITRKLDTSRVGHARNYPMLGKNPLERPATLDTQNLLLNLAKHIVRLIVGIANALIPLGAGYANTPDREG